MRTFQYRAVLEPGDQDGVIVVSFPDVSEAITEGMGEADALAQAEEALGLALLTYPQRQRPLPRAKARQGIPVTVPAEIAAKLAVIEAFSDAAITKAELGRRLKADEREVRRILDPMHGTRLTTLAAALAALGRRLVVGVDEIPWAA